VKQVTRGVRLEISMTRSQTKAFVRASWVRMTFRIWLPRNTKAASPIVRLNLLNPMPPRSTTLDHSTRIPSRKYSLETTSRTSSIKRLIRPNAIQLKSTIPMCLIRMPCRCYLTVTTKQIGPPEPRPDNPCCISSASKQIDDCVFRADNTVTLNARRNW
jgi:hypothetical protein